MINQVINMENNINNFNIEETKYTPLIDFIPINGQLSIKGSSYPENTLDFYAPVLKWLESYFRNTKNRKTLLNIEIIYFNSSSSRIFFEIFDLIEEHNKTHDIQINWIYEKDNENVLEIGEDYQLDFENLNFNLLIK